MNTRLAQFIDYATRGNKKDFAQSLGWSPQYSSGLATYKELITDIKHNQYYHGL